MALPEVKHIQLPSVKMILFTRCSHSNLRLPQPKPLNLLQNDRSTLSSAQWTLLSNLIHAFDEQNPSSRVLCTLNELALLPPKLRFRSSNIYQLIGQFFASVQSMIERSADAHSLPMNARRALTKHNLVLAGSMNGIFLSRELDLYSNAIFLHGSSAYYGSGFLKDCLRHSRRCDTNGNLMKILISISIYSSSCSIVQFDHQEDENTMASSIDLVRIQDTYVTTLWQYLLYLYGFAEAVVRISLLTKNILDILHMLESMPTNATHTEMMDRMIDATERALTIED